MMPWEINLLVSLYFKKSIRLLFLTMNIHYTNSISKECGVKLSEDKLLRRDIAVCVCVFFNKLSILIFFISQLLEICGVFFCLFVFQKNPYSAVTSAKMVEKGALGSIPSQKYGKKLTNPVEINFILTLKGSQKFTITKKTFNQERAGMQQESFLAVKFIPTQSPPHSGSSLGHKIWSSHYEFLVPKGAMETLFLRNCACLF